MELKSGKFVKKPMYNHRTGKMRQNTENAYPNRVILVEGLHTLYDERIRNLLDVSIYIDASDSIKEEWKIERDIKRRGYS